MDKEAHFTVADLIQALSRLPPEAKVYIECDYAYHRCEGVSYDDKTGRVELIPG